MIPVLLLGCAVAIAAVAVVVAVSFVDELRIEWGLHFPAGPVGCWRRIRGTYGTAPGCPECAAGTWHGKGGARHAS